MIELQKANMWKRISAALFDVILLGMLAVGLSLLLSLLFGYDGYATELETLSESYETAAGVDFDISLEEYEKLSEEARAVHDAAYEAFAKDEEANRLYAMLFQLTLNILIFGVLGAFLVLELLIPLLLGNGQTVGKKVFGVGVMRRDGVKLTGVLLFTRAILGKYTVETMLPLLIAVMISFGLAGLGGTLLILLLLAVQLAMLAITHERLLLHDKLSHTVAVDMASQRIFDSPEALLAYKQRLHAEAVERAES